MSNFYFALSKSALLSATLKSATIPVYGSDFLLQCADVMIAFNRPAKYNLGLYGPNKYVIDDKFLLAMHILKNRFGDVGIQWYRAEYAKMTIVEAATPSTRIISSSS